jgi:hypothetical protein
MDTRSYHWISGRLPSSIVQNGVLFIYRNMSFRCRNFRRELYSGIQQFATNVKRSIDGLHGEFYQLVYSQNQIVMKKSVLIFTFAYCVLSNRFLSEIILFQSQRKSVGDELNSK